MKKRIPLSLWRLTAITLALLIFQGCDPNGIEKDVDNTSDMGYEGFQSDVELYYEFVYRKESLLLNYLNYTTDGFTKELFKGEITYEEYDKFFHELAMLNADSPKYKAAIQRLESSGVLQSPTRTRGLFGTGMFSWMGGSKKRARKRVLTVASNLTPEERTTLYKDLRPEWKKQSSSEADFWRQLENGSYDNMAAQMHNDFFHNGNTNYEDLSYDKGLSIQKIVEAEGAAGMKAGVEDMIDTSAKFIPGVDIGANLAKMTDNVDKINNGKDLYEKATNALELLETLEDMAGGDSGLLDEILDELNPVPTKYDVAKSLATKMDHYLKSDIKPGDKEETFGKVTVIDKNKEEPTQYVIIQKKEGTPTDDNTPSIYITGKKYIQKGIDLLVKAGNWLVTAIGENGRRETVEIDVKPGKVTVTEVNTAEPEEDEDDNGDDQSGGKTYYLLGNINFFTSADPTTALEVDLNVYHDSWHINFSGSRGFWLDEFSSCTEPTDFFALKQNKSDKKRFSGKGNVSFTKTVSALGRTYISDINDVTEMELTVDNAKKPTKITKLTLNHTSHQEGHYTNESDIYVFNEKSTLSFKDIPISLLTKYKKKVDVPAKWMKSATYVYNTKGGVGYVKGSDLSPYLVSATGTKDNKSSKKLFAKNTIIMFYYVEKK